MENSATLLKRLQNQQTLNFWLTNRIPRNLATRMMGRFSRIESRWLTRLSIRVWRLFADELRLDEAREREFGSLQACFTRKLKPGARPLDARPEVLVSPCDAVVGAHGRIADGTMLQAKDMAYRLEELLADQALAETHRAGCYITLRLKSSMYHRFHAPCQARLERLAYISGEVFNVNPPALARIPGLFCRNERAILPLQTPFGPLTLVPVAAILVSSMQFSFLPTALRRRLPELGRLDFPAAFDKGEELGWFEHGSTIIVLAGPGMQFAPGVAEGMTICMGQPLLLKPAPGPG